MPQLSITFFYLLTLFFSFHLHSALKIRRFFVPSAIESGKSTVLHCHFDVESDQLYRVTWTKDSERFFRFVYSENQTEAFPVKGINIDKSLSNSSHVALSKVDVKSNGIYSCEVQATGPSYKIVHREERMNVYELPSTGLNVDGIETSYTTDENVKLVCTSPPSFPELKLTWDVNGEPPPSSALKEYPMTERPNGLRITKLAIAFTVTEEHLKSGTLSLECKGKMTMLVNGRNKTIGELNTLINLRSNLIHGEEVKQRESSINEVTNKRTSQTSRKREGKSEKPTNGNQTIGAFFSLICGFVLLSIVFK